MAFVIDYFKLIASLAICIAIGVLGGIWTSRSVNSWYKKIKKPSFNPPNTVFAPVWASLYILMGIALYIVWNKGPGTVIIVFAIQLLLNLLWTMIFFSMKRIFLAFIEIILLWTMILLTIIKFYAVSSIAAYLLIPYLLWVSFAAILNFSIYWLNRTIGNAHTTKKNN